VGSGKPPIPGRLVRVEIAVTAIGADGTVRQAVVETTGRVDAGWWEQLAASAHLEVPPPYRPYRGSRCTRSAPGSMLPWWRSRIWPGRCGNW
jgi:hypothetical protein